MKALVAWFDDLEIHHDAQTRPGTAPDMGFVPGVGRVSDSETLARGDGINLFPPREVGCVARVRIADPVN